MGDMMRSILKLLSEQAEIGVGLAIKFESRYLFSIAGDKHSFKEDELFYAGIGGHLKPGENLIECGKREAKEEIGLVPQIISSNKTQYITKNKDIKKIEVENDIKPLAIYEMVHSERTAKAGELYHIVIYKAKLNEVPNQLKRDEVRSIIALTKDQLIKSKNKKIKLGKLKRSGAKVIAGRENVNNDLKLYPIGTARALAEIFSLKNS